MDTLRILVAPHVVDGYPTDLLSILKADPVEAASRLPLHVGSALMTPKGEGPDHLAANGALFLGCGGPLQGFPETRVPFSARIPVGREKRADKAAGGQAGAPDEGERRPLSGSAAPDGQERP